MPLRSTLMAVGDFDAPALEDDGEGQLDFEEGEGRAQAATRATAPDTAKSIRRARGLWFPQPGAGSNV